MNILLVTLDQFRGDSLSGAGHLVARTPNLDRLAASGVRFARHYSQAAPCSPGRSCLYTGTYQMNNRVVGNGTPLDNRFDNVARMARRAGYSPTVFGYADQGIDPRTASGPNDPRLFTYQSFPPGFDVGLDLPDEQGPWLAELAKLGYDTLADGDAALQTEGDRPAEHGVSAFMTDSIIDWLGKQDSPWFLHASYWRPHPPYAAAGHWSTAYDPHDMPDPLPAPKRSTPFCGNIAAWGAPKEELQRRKLQAQYFGMISDVDAQVGRLINALETLGMWEDTLVLLTSDHGEQLGDQGTLGKGGLFESSYHVPCIIRDPRFRNAHGSVVETFTENVDLFPTICEAMEVEVPAQCDGLPLTGFLCSKAPSKWRDAAHWEYDWRWEYILREPHLWPWDRRLESMHLSVLRNFELAYVHFGDGQWRCFDVGLDPTWCTEITDPDRVLGAAQKMLSWRANHTERTLSDMLLMNGGVGRLPLQSL